MSARGGRVGSAVVVTAIVLVTLLTGSALVGCTNEPTTVISRPKDPKEGTLSAIERGEARRAALEVAKEGLAAFDAGDHDLMRTYFDEAFVNADVQRFDGYEADGRTRHREHEIKNIDATEMSTDGTSVTVSATTIDHSYFIEPNGSKTEPSGEELKMELRLARQDDGSYVIVQIIGGSDALK